jgi:hypothetical protein
MGIFCSFARTEIRTTWDGQPSSGGQTIAHGFTLHTDYVNVFLGTERGRRELLRRVTTSAGNHNINSNSIRLLSLPVPRTKKDQQSIVDIASAARARTSALITKRQALLNLKTALMHDLLTGRVRVDRKHLETAVAS